jgi:hypothetical protein
MTGQAFHKGQLFVINNFQTSSHPDFLNDVDNIKGVKNIENVLLGSLCNNENQVNGII